MMLLTMTTIFAADSASTDGVNFTIHGSISDTYLNGTITGEQANGGSAQVTGYFYDVRGASIYAGSMSGSPYVNYWYKAAEDRVGHNYEAWKWHKGNATGIPRSGIRRSTRMLIN